VAWAPGEDDLGVASRTYQVDGQKREQLALGWEAALESHRPFLSYDDLGQLVTSTPSQLHDSIARALGLDELNEAVERLRTRVVPLKAPLKKTNEDRKKLRSALVDVDDDRARAAHALLGKTEPDLDALSVLVAGGAQANAGPAEICARILAVTLPAGAHVEAAASELEGAQAALADLGERRSRAAELRDQLLTEALEYHAAAGETPCPVCEVGVLDAAWQTRTMALLQQTDLLRQAHQEAESRLQRAELAARRLLSPPPAVLGQTDVDLPSQAAAAEAWGRWSLPASPDPEHLRTQLPLLTTAVADWQSEARDHAESIAERWAPFALPLAALVTDYRKALALDQKGRHLDDAYAAGTGCVATLREERLRPIVEQTLQIWSQLKQESNVSLEAIALTSRNTRRGVDIRAVVDDASGANALSVMSQGELNSLALAMYLPRATSDESPFRFLVLDDPVQAMDPTKVEGLATVLADLARTRQVIVFSHDDRLAHAARRLPDAPTILSVQRDRHSRVIVQNETRPAQRQLDDAHAIVRENGMNDNVKRRVLPGVLRAAIEAAAWHRLCAERLKAGDRLEDLEQQWSGAERTRARLEVLLGASVSIWLSRDQRRTGTCGLQRRHPPADDVQPARGLRRRTCGCPGHREQAAVTGSDGPADLLALARDVADGRHQVPGMSQARAVCLLTRQALEQVVDALLDARHLACPAASMRARLISLGQAFGSDPEHVAYRAETAWSRLSAACHQHAYELSPSLSEARALVDEVTWLSRRRLGSLPTT